MITPALFETLRYVGRFHQVTVITFQEPEGPRDYRIDGIRVRAAGGKARSAISLFADCWREMSGLHHERPFDLVHGLWGTRAAFLAVTWGRAHRVRSMVSFFGGEPVSFPELDYGGWRSARGRISLRSAVKNAGLITASSQYLIDKFHDVDLEGAWRRWSIGIDQAPFRAVVERRSPGLSQPPLLLSVADWGLIKDHRTLLEAVARLRRSRPIRLRLAGTPKGGAPVRELIDRLELGDVVEVVGRIPHDLLAETYREADLLVHTSRHEGEGLVYLEAAAAGCPVVSTAVGLAIEMAGHGAVELVPVGDAAALARGLELMLAETLLREHRAQRARVWAESYDLEASGGKLLELYQELKG